MMSKPLVVVVVAAAMTAAAVVSTRATRATRSPANSSAPAGGTLGGSGGPSHQPGQTGGQTPSQSTSSHLVNPLRNGSAINEGRTGGNGNNSVNPTRARVTGVRQTRAKNGNYITIVAGDFSGTGNAEVKDDKVSINADVLTCDGRAGKFTATNLTVEGPYFYGVGTVLGLTVQVSGRVDAARASRLLATFTAGDGKAARVVGNLPAAFDAGDDGWDDIDQSGRLRH
jgi:hypothetical protein